MEALLCERCGYEIHGLEADKACPECGTPIADSLPSRRIGSPWQRRPGLWSWILTNYRAIRRPMRTFGSMRLDIRSGIGLAALNLLLAAAIMVGPWTGVLIGDPTRGAGGPAALWVIPIQILSIALLLLLLTALAWALVQLLALGRGWRLSRTAAWQVCAHSTVGWVITGITMWLALIVWLNLIWFIPGLPQGGTTGGLLLLGVPLAGIAFGLLIVMLLLKAGIERCRFANAPGESPPGVRRTSS